MNIEVFIVFATLGYWILVTALIRSLVIALNLHKTEKVLPKHIQKELENLNRPMYLLFLYGLFFIKDRLLTILLIFLSSVSFLISFFNSYKLFFGYTAGLIFLLVPVSMIFYFIARNEFLYEDWIQP